MRTLPLFALLVVAACGNDDSSGVGDTHGTSAPVPTWHADVRPLLHEHCSACHEAGGIADRLPWATYEDTQPWAALIAEQVASREMPPFIADSTDDCAERFPLMHDSRLTEEQIDLLERWSAGGAPEGDPATAAPLTPPASLSLENWDLEVAPEHGYDMPKGDVSICWSLDPGLEQAAWLEAVEVMPGDQRVTHHIQIQVHDTAAVDNAKGPSGFWECTGVGGLGGTDFAGWLPGTRPVEMPEGVAVEMKPGGRITMQIHYHNVFDETIHDLTRLRLRFGKNPPYIEPQIFRVGNADTAAEGLLPGPNDAAAPEFRIPAGTSGHTEEMQFTVPGQPGNEWYAFMLTNHMHQVGVDMRMWVVHDPATKLPDEPLEECLLATPRYDFGWQAFFYYDAPRGQAPIIRQGDKIKIRCTFDNTTANDAWMEALASEGLPPTPRDVFFGESSLDEMCLGMVGVLDKSDTDAL